ncbi:RagB/SusD family nutrient uptake outer membrane protein [Flagellimonas sp. HMM57]|uniref:RagB/SusD family nutrient uptake outer membrane protein n=1 Tax=unclassified Flagellimonas TaxID=2644544 RepID=UPI0013D72EF3|nr:MULTISPECIES: RagB/SusD family nutrient uptake outer membrane protein [unclassified Flagellimonas]UII77300.1 RagB/SusD family nutrient uptake outer membrane protein [Flagellimonas sp. HMM57]
MKRIRKIKYFSFALIGMIAFSACDDFLEEDPKSDITAENFINEENADQLVVGIYSELRDVYRDYTFKFFGTDLFASRAEAFSFTPENDYFNLNAGIGFTVWASNYRVIGRANIAINRFLNEIDFSESNIPERDLGVAQARALRALAYFNLVQQYGGVPIELEEQTTVRTDYTRASEAEVYLQIIDDLETAIPILEDSPDPGRFSSRAAQHLLAEVYLTRAYTTFAEANDFQAAAGLAEAAIGSYDIRSQSYAEVFDIDNQINDEILFAIQWGIEGLAEDFNNNKHSIFMSQVFQYPGISRTGNIYGVSGYDAQPTNFFYSLFADNDTREEATIHRVLFADEEVLFDPDGDGPIPSDLIQPGDTAIFFPKNMLDDAELANRLNRYFVYQPDQYEFGLPDNIPGVTYQYSSNILRNNFPIFKKFDDTVFDETEGGARDTFVFRVAGTHLLAAEAHLGAGNTGQALFHMNRVRERATGVADELTEVDIDAIIDERARELAGETNRWAVLKRTGKLEERINLYNPQVIDHGAFDSSIHLLRPIPDVELQLTDGSLEQNPGY